MSPTLGPVMIRTLEELKAGAGDSQDISIEQYRCLVAHMLHWDGGLAQALHDVGIHRPREQVLDMLWKAGYDYDGDLDRIRYRHGDSED